MTEQSQTRTSKKFHRLSLKQTKSSLVWICVPVLFMGSQLEIKGLDPALISTLTIMTDPRLPTQEGSVKGQYLVCCQWNWKSLSCVWLCNPMDYTVHGILQARILEWVAFPFSRGSSQPRDWTYVSCIVGGSLPAESQGKPVLVLHSFLWLNNISLYGWTIFHLSIFPFIDGHLMRWFPHFS